MLSWGGPQVLLDPFSNKGIQLWPTIIKIAQSLNAKWKGAKTNVKGAGKTKSKDAS